MTKSELIKLLEPLDDDQEIWAHWEDCCWQIDELFGITADSKRVEWDNVDTVTVALCCEGERHPDI